MCIMCIYIYIYPNLLTHRGQGERRGLGNAAPDFKTECTHMCVCLSTV